MKIRHAYCGDEGGAVRRKSDPISAARLREINRRVDRINRVIDGDIEIDEIIENALDADRDFSAERLNRRNPSPATFKHRLRRVLEALPVTMSVREVLDLLDTIE